MILKIQIVGNQFMLSLPASYVHVYGIRKGDLFELHKDNKGFHYRKLTKKEIVDREFGKGTRPIRNITKEGETKL